LDSVLNTWYSNKTEFVICGDININYLGNLKKKTTSGCPITNL